MCLNIYITVFFLGFTFLLSVIVIVCIWSCFTRPQLVIKDMKWQTETEEKMTAQDSRNKHVNSLELYSFLLYINCFDFHCSPEV